MDDAGAGGRGGEYPGVARDQPAARVAGSQGGLRPVPVAEHLGVEPGALLDIADQDAEMRDGSDRDHHRPSRLRFAVGQNSLCEPAYAILRNAVQDCFGALRLAMTSF